MALKDIKSGSGLDHLLRQTWVCCPQTIADLGESTEEYEDDNFLAAIEFGIMLGLDAQAQCKRVLRWRDPRGHVVLFIARDEQELEQLVITYNRKELNCA